jgi:predicted ArsR family transcriptional regulator
MTDERRPAPPRSPSEEEAKALASAVRMRILRLCLQEQLTNKEIATRLGANPATVLFHVRKLVAAGFLEAQDARSGPSGAYEVPYLATGKSARLSMDARDMGLRSAMINAFVSEVGQVPDSAEVEISRRGVRLTKAGHDRFLDRMMELLDELSAQEPPESDEDATRYSIFMAVHPETYTRPKT